MNDTLLTIADVAERLRVSEKTVRTLIYGDPKRGKDPEIDSFKIGPRMRRIWASEVDRWVAERQDQPATD